MFIFITNADASPPLALGLSLGTSTGVSIGSLIARRNYNNLQQCRKELKICKLQLNKNNTNSLVK